MHAAGMCMGVRICQVELRCRELRLAVEPQRALAAACAALADTLARHVARHAMRCPRAMPSCEAVPCQARHGLGHGSAGRLLDELRGSALAWLERLSLLLSTFSARLRVRLGGGGGGALAVDLAQACPYEACPLNLARPRPPHLHLAASLSHRVHSPLVRPRRASWARPRSAGGCPPRRAPARSR